jgi:hypothetical protein
MNRRLIEQFQNRWSQQDTETAIQSPAESSAAQYPEYVTTQLHAVAEQPELQVKRVDFPADLISVSQYSLELRSVRKELIEEKLRRILKTDQILQIFGKGVAFGLAVYCAGEQSPAHLSAIADWLVMQQQSLTSEKALLNDERMTSSQYQELMALVFERYEWELMIADDAE